jgi:hypothetical protein
MIADALRAEIDVYAQRARRQNPLFCMAEAGSLRVGSVKRYLANVHHLILHTPVYLVRARDAARARGDERLARHYHEKLGEEAGHDVWAERDLELLRARAPAAGGDEVVPATRELVAYLASVIDAAPALYLAYILFAEHLTVLMGSEWLGLLEQRCGVPRSAMSVIGNHAELDREHVEAALDSIDELVADPRKLAAMREVIHRSTTYFDQLCVEVTSTESAHEASAAQHVPAA